MTSTVHDSLPCGVEYGVTHLPGRHVVSMQIMVLAGTCTEPAAKLGLARILAETLDKGTEHYTGRQLSDAFDAIGTTQHVGAGRETTTLSCTVLPEHFDRAIELCAEMLRRPTFPQEFVDVNVELARQELLALEDDPQALLDKLIGPPAFGPLLGRHALGEKATLDTITRGDVVAQWKANFSTGRMIVAVAGAVEPRKAADTLERHFAGFGSAAAGGRAPHAVAFEPGATHVEKELEQEQIGICWPGVSMTDEDFPTQQIVLGVLSGGMGARLFTEVREKQGLVYWVSAWQDTPRGTGMIFMGASTTPERCDTTYTTLLREVQRLSEDIEQEELQRAIIGVVAHNETRGDTTRSYCGELANDLFQFGRPVPRDEKLAKIRAVTIEGAKRYLAAYPADPRCVMTLGPRPLSRN